MKKRQLLIPVLTGLIAGQIFAESDRPFTVMNTVRFGYDDNVYRTSDDQTESAYVQDIIDLSFRAALSERTDLIFQSRFDYRSDKESKFYPSLNGVLTHSVSPRLLLQLSDKFTSGNRTSRDTDGRNDYFRNTLSFTPSYVLSPKDSLSAPLSYTILRHEEELDGYDSDTFAAGLSWKRELSPQRTWVALHVKQTMIDYINSEYDMTTDSTMLAAQLSHTFNPEWQGDVMLGFTFDQIDLSDLGTNRTSEAVNPYFSAGLAYEPTPRTRFTANVSQQYKESDFRQSAGGTFRELALGAEHDLTARITGKVTARLSESEYDGQDSVPGTGDTSEENFDLDFRLQYQLNRINFIELGMRHREKSYDDADRSWDQNMIDVGWRVEL